MLKLHQPPTELHLELLHTTVESDIGIAHEAKHKGAGHLSKHLVIKLMHGSTLTAQKVILNDKGYRLASYSHQRPNGHQQQQRSKALGIKQDTRPRTKQRGLEPTTPAKLS